MGDILEFKRPKPLKGFIPDQMSSYAAEPICVECIRISVFGHPDSFTCRGGNCPGNIAMILNDDGGNLT